MSNLTMQDLEARWAKDLPDKEEKLHVVIASLRKLASEITFPRDATQPLDALQGFNPYLHRAMSWWTALVDMGERMCPECEEALAPIRNEYYEQLMVTQWLVGHILHERSRDADDASDGMFWLRLGFLAADDLQASVVCLATLLVAFGNQQAESHADDVSSAAAGENNPSISQALTEWVAWLEKQGLPTPTEWTP